jgi:hypothetical protein
MMPQNRLQEFTTRYKAVTQTNKTFLERLRINRKVTFELNIIYAPYSKGGYRDGG